MDCVRVWRVWRVWRIKGMDDHVCTRWNVLSQQVISLQQLIYYKIRNYMNIIFLILC